MSKEKPRTERFDEAFKMLLIIMTMAFSVSIAFYKEIMEFKFFSLTGEAFIMTIILWSFSTLYDGEHEYGIKIGAWYLLMLTYLILFARLHYAVPLLPPFVASLIILVTLALTLPMLEYLKEAVTEEDYKFLRIGLSFPILAFIIVDVLYSLGLVTFPIF